MTNYNLEKFEKLIEDSCDFIAKSAHNTRVHLKYRNKPARGKLNITNNHKVNFYFSV